MEAYKYQQMIANGNGVYIIAISGVVCNQDRKPGAFKLIAKSTSTSPLSAYTEARKEVEKVLNGLIESDRHPITEVLYMDNFEDCEILDFEAN